jgi:hypothetical protein
MNAKLAKALRARARRMTVGEPLVAYVVDRRNPTSRRVDLHTTRGAYLLMKKQIRSWS